MSLCQTVLTENFHCRQNAVTFFQLLCPYFELMLIIALRSDCLANALLFSCSCFCMVNSRLTFCMIKAFKPFLVTFGLCLLLFNLCYTFPHCFSWPANGVRLILIAVPDAKYFHQCIYWMKVTGSLRKDGSVCRSNQMSPPNSVLD